MSNAWKYLEIERTKMEEIMKKKIIMAGLIAVLGTMIFLTGCMGSRREEKRRGYGICE